MSNGPELASRTAALEVVVAVTEAAHLASDEEDLARNVNDVLCGQGKVHGVAAYRIAPDGATLELLDDEGLPPGRKAPASMPIQGSLTGAAISAGRLVHVFDIRKDETVHPSVRELLVALGVGSACSIPVRFRNTMLGGITMMWREVRDLTPFEKEAYESVGRAVGLAIHNLRRMEELQAAMEDAAGQHEQMRLVLETVPLRLFWKDQEGRYTGCNLLFAQDTGHDSVSKVIGKTDADMPWKTQAAKLKAIDLEIMKTGQGKKYELDLERADGSVHRERVSKMPVRDRFGDVIGVLGCYEDVTERLSGDFKS